LFTFKLTKCFTENNQKYVCLSFREEKDSILLEIDLWNSCHTTDAQCPKNKGLFSTNIILHTTVKITVFSI
jgi:hypothetical protein